MRKFLQGVSLYKGFPPSPSSKAPEGWAHLSGSKFSMRVSNCIVPPYEDHTILIVIIIVIMIMIIMILQYIYIYIYTHEYIYIYIYIYIRISNIISRLFSLHLS